MKLESLAIQGSALTVVLLCFIYLLKWLLSHFATSLMRIEQLLYAVLLAVAGVTRLIFHSSFDTESQSEEQVIKLLTETNDHITELMELLRSMRADVENKLH